MWSQTHFPDPSGMTAAVLEEDSSKSNHAPLGDPGIWPLTLVSDPWTTSWDKNFAVSVDKRFVRNWNLISTKEKRLPGQRVLANEFHEFLWILKAPWKVNYRMYFVVDKFSRFPFAFPCRDSSTNMPCAFFVGNLLSGSVLCYLLLSSLVCWFIFTYFYLSAWVLS